MYRVLREQRAAVIFEARCVVTSVRLRIGFEENQRGATWQRRSFAYVSCIRDDAPLRMSRAAVGGRHRPSGRSARAATCCYSSELRGCDGSRASEVEKGQIGARAE